jgi:hypothetical protein
MKQKLLAFIGIIFLTAVPMRVLAAGDVDAKFNPSKLIEDRVFSDTKTFSGPDGIQKFLESKNSILANTSPAFLAKLKEPSIKLLKESLDDPHPSAGHLRTAAEIIWDASQASGLNPQVILVTLNKEQSLITGRQTDSAEQVQRALDFAMGFDCPDSSGCGNLFPGFYFQLFGNLDNEGNRYLGAAKSLMKSFNTPGGRGPAVNGSPAHIGDTITLDNTLGGYNGVQARQSLTLSNAATAALYRYTPHVFNGNYNFWKFFQAWFRFSNGTLLRNKKNIYIIQNGAKQKVPTFVAQARGLNLASAISVSVSELDSYPTEKLYGPADNTIISVDGKLYVFLDNVKHPASSFVISQRGLNAANAITVKSADADLFEKGSQLTPSDGTVLKGEGSTGIFLVDGGVLKLFTPFTFAQRKAAGQVQTIPDTEIDTYLKQGFVSPLDGTVLKGQGSGAVYFMQDKVKRPLTMELFKNRGLTFASISVLTDDQVAAIPTGDFATPKDNTYFTTGKDFYLYREGAKHRISEFVAAQKHMTPDFTFGADIADKWPTGIPIAPRDGTVLKGSSAAVYLVQGGQLRPLTYQAYLNRKLTPAKISVVPQAEIDAYAKGDVVAK